MRLICQPIYHFAFGSCFLVDSMPCLHIVILVVVHSAAAAAVLPFSDHRSALDSLLHLQSHRHRLLRFPSLSRRRCGDATDPLEAHRTLPKHRRRKVLTADYYHRKAFIFNLGDVSTTTRRVILQEQIPPTKHAERVLWLPLHRIRLLAPAAGLICSTRFIPPPMLSIVLNPSHATNVSKWRLSSVT